VKSNQTANSWKHAVAVRSLMVARRPIQSNYLADSTAAVRVYVIAPSCRSFLPPAHTHAHTHAV